MVFGARLGTRVAAVAAAWALAGCGASSSAGAVAPHPSTSTSAPGSTRASAPGSASSTAVAPARRRRPAPDPGRLPQTGAQPSAHTAAFGAEMSALWQGVVSNRVTSALPSFFPESAYLQVKAISDAAADWHDRLVGGFGLDLAAAHGLLGNDPGRARLIGVSVPAGYAHWVVPGVCYNRVGYWEVPNSRVIYRLNGQVRSFGIASMISWRGVWYVVHLGAVVPTTSGGEVDDPSVGPGTSAPSSTC